MTQTSEPGPDFAALVDNINVGIVVVNRDFEIVSWNRFMAAHSGHGADAVVGRNIFEAFPELPQRWLKQKLRSVFLLNHQAFSSWEHRPYLFEFPHNRPITGGVDAMRQDCTFFPIPDDSGEPAYVCITIFDMTDASIYQERLQRTKQDLEELSARDRLTWLYNRGQFETELHAAFKHRERHGGHLAVILLDIDHFKTINDHQGHDTGDAVLRHLAVCIRDSIRASDVAGRFGGEEFALFLPETDIAGARAAAERLRQHIHEHPAEHNGMAVGITVSMGVSEATDGMPDPEALMKEADLALYQAKEAGRDRIVVYGENGAG
ncbi:PAS domain S-box-containing protein/diguanylate cyclase (GGDEF) domain-containing protein [Limimonas halophila]|uniref:diguanylate cyclase n=1 Tax=Limimonas halophila TaxID=1082479 RepID=A0A1G7KW13_9PROT|nr:diguanylate cyclase [Limimonas halophila]SDF41301.1 PAS domain S-box-containing protein/diguanylate cyclase (GGDEF) domain-containing protein [Limimonas halophila]